MQYPFTMKIADKHRKYEIFQCNGIIFFSKLELWLIDLDFSNQGKTSNLLLLSRKHKSERGKFDLDH